MKKLFGSFIIFFFLSSQMLAQSRHPFTGSYDYTGYNETGTIDVLQLSDSMIKYYIFDARKNYSGGIAERGGIVELKGNDVFTRSGDDQSGCPLHFHFEKNKVTISEGQGDCEWGYNATAAGIYIKSKRAPDLNEEWGDPFTIISSRAYFYVDSSLTQPKKSYLIVGDTIHERESSGNAIYTEIYNKKRLTLTYGWIAKKDLMEVKGK